MGANKFGKASKLFLRARAGDGNTILEDVSFTAPFKVMTPFHTDSGKGITVMVLSASAGIMEGDTQELELHIETGADLELISQSYEKIHRMNSGSASRKTEIAVGKNACFRYCPQPSIPFQGSAFSNRTRILLEDKTSHLFLSEVLTCGRYASQEIFLYRFFCNLVEVYRGGNLIYRDNSRFFPESCEMGGVGMYESHFHLLNIFITGVGQPDGFISEVNKILSQNDVEGGITKLADGDFGIRAFGKRAQQLESAAAEVSGCWHERL